MYKNKLKKIDVLLYIMEDAENIQDLYLLKKYNFFIIEDTCQHSVLSKFKKL